MSNSDLYKDILDKAFVALLVVLATWFVNLILEKRKARFAYLQKLAERQLDAYWEMMGILSTQAFHVQYFVQAFERYIKNPTNEGFDEIKNYWSEFAKAYSTDQSKILQSSFLLPPTVVTALAKHQRSVKNFSIAANPAKEVETQYQNAREISSSLTALIDEISKHVRRCPV